MFNTPKVLNSFTVIQKFKKLQSCGRDYFIYFQIYSMLHANQNNIAYFFVETLLHNNL